MHEDPETLPLAKSERSDITREKLTKFIEKASTGRLRKTWSTAKDIPGLVALSMSKTIKTYPAIGWIRADKNSNEEDLRKLINLQNENEKLRKENESMNASSIVIPLNTASLDTIFTINYKQYTGSIMARGTPRRGTIKKSFADIFAYTSPLIYKTADESSMKRKMNEFLHSICGGDSSNTYISDDDFQTISLQFVALKLIEISGESWSLTTDGINMMMNLKLVRN
ncbi:hypothetical protein [Pantoea sp.]|uniref:hypothetical protein n=1 Tax=Pantoea sp. TaxID=69393 RepID=UPI0031E3AA73